MRGISREHNSYPITSIYPYTNKVMWHKETGTVKYNEEKWLKETFETTIKKKK